MLSLDKLMMTYPKHLWIELSSEAQTEAQQQSQNCSNDVARWNAYVNYLCLNAFVDWLRGEPDLQEALLVSPSRHVLPSIWEVVNGSAIEFGQTRLILIPSETDDLDELRVPQEWVDIPSWAGEYYLAVQMQLEDDECWMRVWGVTTHQKLKQGSYNSIKRTYSANREDLIESLNAMWVAREACPEEKPLVESLQPISEKEVDKLLEELGQKTLYSPRLEVPFAQWGALLENEEWRQELYLRRLGREAKRSPSEVAPPLSQWFEIEKIEIVQAIKAAGWQRYEEVFSQVEAIAFARRFRSSDAENTISWVKQISSEMATNYPIALILNLRREADGTIWILPQLRPIGAFDRQACLPESLQLMVVDNLGEIFDRVEAGSASNLIQLDDWFNAALKEKFSLKLALNNTSATEHFVI